MLILNGRFLGTRQTTGTQRASRGLLKSLRPYLGDFTVYGRYPLAVDEPQELDRIHEYQALNPFPLSSQEADTNDSGLQ